MRDSINFPPEDIARNIHKQRAGGFQLANKISGIRSRFSNRHSITPSGYSVRYRSTWKKSMPGVFLMRDAKRV
jgi:hypothetical protein